MERDTPRTSATVFIGNRPSATYSPDFNPIENAFAKLKALLRAKAERTIKALWDAVGPLLDLFTPAECANYFKAAGYEPH
ncbi:transposase [Mesorhizobium sp. USDA 4775]